MFSSAGVTAEPTDDWCNPVVEPISGETTTEQALTILAEKYNFNLSFPRDLDHPVRIDDRMRLDQMIKLLTADLNTALRHEKVDGCSMPRLSELTIMPTGEETEYIRVKRHSPPQTYIYIDNMEQYVTDVLMRKHKANLKNMTPEQKIEFKIHKKRLKRELKEEIKQNKNKKRKNKKKKKKKKKKGTADKTGLEQKTVQ